jgi:hypothetical protein
VPTEPSTGHVRGAPDWTEVEGWQPPDETDNTTTATATTGTTADSSSPAAATSAAANTAATGGGAAAGLPRELPHIVSGFVSIFVVYAALAAALSWGLGDNNSSSSSSSNNSSSSSSSIKPKSSVERRPAAVLDDCIQPLPPSYFSHPAAPATAATVPAVNAAATKAEASSDSSSGSATEDTPSTDQEPYPQRPTQQQKHPQYWHGRGESRFISDTPLAFEKDAHTGYWVQQSLLAAEDAAFRTGSVPYSSFAKLLSVKKRREAEAAAAKQSGSGQQDKEPLLSSGEVEVPRIIYIHVCTPSLHFIGA